MCAFGEGIGKVVFQRIKRSYLARERGRAQRILETQRSPGTIARYSWQSCKTVNDGQVGIDQIMKNFECQD